MHLQGYREPTVCRQRLRTSYGRSNYATFGCIKTTGCPYGSDALQSKASNNGLPEGQFGHLGPCTNPPFYRHTGTSLFKLCRFL